MSYVTSTVSCVPSTIGDLLMGSCRDETFLAVCLVRFTVPSGARRVSPESCSVVLVVSMLRVDGGDVKGAKRSDMLHSP